jgi:hypothetical protein
MNFNKKIVEEITKRSPGNRRMVKNLARMLSISNESAYRRVREEIPFTLEEVAILADSYKLSVDGLLGLKSDVNPFFNREFINCWDSGEIYARQLGNDLDCMKKLLEAKEVRITAALRRIPFRLLPFPALFKFDYCHYLYSVGKISLMNARFSGMTVPASIDSLHRKIAACTRKITPVVCIIDSAIYANIIKKVLYYYRLGFLSGDDLKLLQSELFGLLDIQENLLRNGKNEFGAEYVFYYSFFNFEASVILVESDGDSLLMIPVYPEFKLVAKNNPEMNTIQQRWFESKIRNSALITKTSDIQQIELLRNAYRQIEELTEKETFHFKAAK